MVCRESENNVASLLGTIITLYYDAATAFDHAKSQCYQRRVAQPSRILEESVDQAPEAIEREKSRGTSRFGEQFEKGDEEATSELQKIVSHLQNNLLEKLRDGAECDQEVDYTSLIDAADLGRDRTVAVLLDLKRRMLDVDATSRQSSISEAKINHLATPELGANPLSKSAEDVRQEPQSQTVGGAPVKRAHSRRTRTSLLGMFKHVRHRSNSVEQLYSSRRKSSSNSNAPVAVAATPSTIRPTDQQDYFASDKDEYGGLEIKGGRKRGGTTSSNDLDLLSNSLASTTLSSTQSSSPTMSRGRAIPPPSVALGMTPPYGISRPSPDNGALNAEKKNSDAKDSMFSNDPEPADDEPWCEDLSEFPKMDSLEDGGVLRYCRSLGQD